MTAPMDLPLATSVPLVAAFASPAPPTAAPDWGLLLMTLLGGLALFLFGIDQMSQGLKKTAGGRMKTILARFTSNPLRGAVSGTFVTAVIQSSSVTTVLLVGFVASGLMTLTQSVGVIMGANIGTTVAVQVIAFDVGQSALAIIASGFLLRLVARKERLRQTGMLVLSLGLIFYGMDLMSAGMRPLRDYEPFIEGMGALRNPAAAILAGALFTALVQASAAAMGVAIVLAGQGLIDLPTGIALTLGANLGTCVTALLATIGRNRSAVQVAIVHVFFNLFGAALWFAFISDLAGFVRTLTPGEDGAAAVPRQLANAHAVFNLANTLLLLPFSGLIARMVERLLPARPEGAEVQPRYLDPDALHVPSIALRNARLETARLADFALELLGHVPDAMAGKNGALLAEMEAEDNRADTLQAAALRFLGDIRKLDLSEDESRQFQQIMLANDSLERINDTLSDDIVEICRRKAGEGLVISEPMMEQFNKLYEMVVETLREARSILCEDELPPANAILDRKDEIKARIAAIHRHQERRFQEAGEDRLAVFRMEMNLVEKLHRIYSLSKRIAHAYADTEAP